MAKKTAKAKKRRKTKGEAIAEIQEILEKIEAKEKEVESAEIEWNTKREETKIAKGVWMTRVSELRELARTRERWAEEAKRQPLFNPPKTDVQSPAADQAIADRVNDELRFQTLGAAGFKPKHLDALEAAGLRYLSDLQEKMNQHGQFWAKELGVARMRDAIEKTFNDHVALVQAQIEDELRQAEGAAVDSETPAEAETAEEEPAAA